MCDSVWVGKVRVCYVRKVYRSVKVCEVGEVRMCGGGTVRVCGVEKVSVEWRK